MPAKRRLFGFLVTFTIAFAASAADPDCHGYAPDGMPKCAPPVVSDYSYATCIANSLITTSGASSYCHNIHGPLTNEERIAAWINCVYNRLYHNTTTYVTPPIAWRPQGSAENNFQCWNLSVVYKYGVEMRGFARYDLGYATYVRRDRTAACPSGYRQWGNTYGFPDFCVRPGSQSTRNCPDGEELNPATNTCVPGQNKELGQPACSTEEGG